MKKLPFSSDYMHLCHPRILERMAETADKGFLGYGTDEICESAKEKIRKACQTPDAEVDFVIGGTQANVVTINALLQSYQGVLATETGHIAVHEAGGVEATGHKVITLPSYKGKIQATDIEEYLTKFYADETWEHLVQPGAVYITHPTEVGTLYSLDELTEISQVCHRRNLKLYLDGARLGYGLMATGADIILPDIARLTDAFYIGGTKVGALLGEAVVFPHKEVVSNFFTQIKRHLSLMAKGWIIGLQFDTLFTDNLYFDISRHAINMAEMLKAGLKNKNLKLASDSPTNQQFVILSDKLVKSLREKVDCEVWETLPEGNKVIRLCTSWHTQEEEIEQLLSYV